MKKKGRKTTPAMLADSLALVTAAAESLEVVRGWLPGNTQLLIAAGALASAAKEIAETKVADTSALQFEEGGS